MKSAKNWIEIDVRKGSLIDQILDELPDPPEIIPERERRKEEMSAWPELKGSEAQVKWAIDIRRQKVYKPILRSMRNEFSDEDAEAIHAKILELYNTIDGKELKGKQAYEQFIRDTIVMHPAMKSAKKWIDAMNGKHCPLQEVMSLVFLDKPITTKQLYDR